MASIKLFTRNILETGTLSVTGTADTGYSEPRLYDRQPSLYWKDTVTEAKSFTLDQGATDNLAVDCLLIPKHNFDAADMSFQYSTDNFSGDINDAVTAWTQGDNLQIVKPMTAALTKRYWRVTLSSMANPRCGELFMSYGYEFEVAADGPPIFQDISKVTWTPSVGGLKRSVKHGDVGRNRQYTLLLNSADKTNYLAAMNDLSGYSKGFYFKDTDGDYFMAHLPAPPAIEPNREDSYARIRLVVSELL